MGRLKKHREQRKTALAVGRAEQRYAKLRRNLRAWCPECQFQMFSAAGRILDFCARCGFTREPPQGAGVDSVSVV